MIYILSGVETINKGAELMLYAILQEIESRDPKAVVYLPTARMPGGLASVKTPLDIRELPNHKLTSAFAKMRITGALNRAGLWSDFLNEVVPVRRADYFLDASGLHFTDQMGFGKPMIRYWDTLLRNYHAQGTRIVFLPQAFGPLEQTATRQAVSALDKYANIIMPRDDISARYLGEVLEHPEKMHLFRDFTTLVKGVVPEHLKHLEGAVCIIPNYQMVRKGIMAKEAYIDYLATLAEALKNSGHGVFFLDHEDDAPLLLTDRRITDGFEVIRGLHALEIKGLIGISSLCITSRFHGAVSALNGGVPCLATSWNHKYQALLEGFGQDNCLLPVDDPARSAEMAFDLLQEPRHSAVKAVLKEKADQLRQENKDMWELIWNLQ